MPGSFLLTDLLSLLKPSFAAFLGGFFYQVFWEVFFC